MFGIEHFGLFVITSLTLIILPGPDILYVLSRGLAGSKKEALAAAAGFAFGNFVHLGLLLLGISAIIQNSPSIYQAIKIAGAFYLLYLAYQIWNATKLIPDELTDNQLAKKTTFTTFHQSFTANLLNPKVITFFISLFPQFVAADHPNKVRATLFLGIVFIIMTWIIFSLVAYGSNQLGAVLKRHKKIEKLIPKIASSIIAIIALLLLIK